MRAFALLAPALLCACAAGPKYRDDPTVAARADTKALGIKTTVKARSVTFVLSQRWSGEMKLQSRRRETPSAGVVRATGQAVLDLRELHIEADEIEVRFLSDPEHEDVLLHARDVKVFFQHVVYGHRTENADLVTMANNQITIFNQ